MASDRQLSANFWLHEFPCWEVAIEGDVTRLRETVQRVLQPFRSHVGVPVIPTSWKWWRSGCTLRDGAHGQAGTVDFDAPALSDSQLDAAFTWGVVNLLPAGYLGRWIIESNVPGVQGRHIHAAPRDDMVAYGGPGDIGAYREGPPGTYTPAAAAGDFGGHSGAYGDPIPLEGITAAVGYNWARWVWLGVVAGLLLRPPGRRGMV